MVIAVTLFLVVINSVLRVLPAGLYILVYADDIHLLATGKHPKIIRRRLQPAVLQLADGPRELAAVQIISGLLAGKFKKFLHI